MKVSKKVFGLIFSVLVSVVMSLSMSFFMLIVNMGFVSNFLLIWFKSASVGILIGLPIAITTIPVIQKVLSRYLVIKE